MDYSKALDNEGWSAHYNIASLNSVTASIEMGEVSVWSEELIKICQEDTRTLEIGCGTGISSLWLAKNGRNVTALDYTESSVELVRAAAERLNLSNVDVIHCDATKELPFKEKQFDYIFQAGLLEHFGTEDINQGIAIYSEAEIEEAWAAKTRRDEARDNAKN